MMDPAMEDTRSAEPATLASRLAGQRRILAVAAVLAGLAWGVFSVPGIAVLAALAALTAAAAFGPAPRTERTTTITAAPAGPAQWPDTGMKLTVDALDDPCFLTDAAGLVRYQNEAATLRFGPPRPGDPLSFKLRVPELLAAMERVGRGQTVAPVRFTERVPTERQYLAICRPIRLLRRDGRSRDRVAFVLLRLQDESELMRLERMRGDFIANASHELRTPLASLSGFIETLLGPARNDEVNRERFLKIMQEQAIRMARLIDDLLSLSRIEMKAHLRPDATVDLSEVAGHAVEILAPLAADQNVRIERALAGPAPILGDRDELIQVVTNLVENAIKYGRTGGRVAISLAAETGPAGAAGFQIQVSDEGPGIPPEHLPRLTERFYRADAAHSRKQRGTGLGLAIVKHIVNRHRGRLTIRSTLGEGSTFSVWLPQASFGAPTVEEKRAEA